MDSNTDSSATESDCDDFPGVDYKRIVRPISNKLRRRHGFKFSGRVAQKLKEPEVIEQLQLLNPNGAVMIDIEAWPPMVSLNLVDPLSRISFPNDFNYSKSKCEGLISQTKYTKPTEDGSEPTTKASKRNKDPKYATKSVKQTSNPHEKEGFLDFPKILMKSDFWDFKTPKDLKTDPAPHIATVNFKWRNKVVIQEESSPQEIYSSILTTVPLNFSSKRKYAQALSDLSYELSQDQDDIIHLLDANDPKSKGCRRAIQSGTFVQRSFHCSSEDMCIYDDQVQHKMLLVPPRSKRGYDIWNLNSTFSFPVTAQFKLGETIFERKFDLNLKILPEPQQYCFSFLFPTKDLTASVFRLVISIYTIFPVSAREARLTAYFPKNVSTPNLPKPVKSVECKGEFNSGRLASDLVNYITQDLEKVDFESRHTVCYEGGWRHHQKGTYSFRWNRRSSYRDRRYYVVEKHKKKQNVFVNMKSDFRNLGKDPFEYDAVYSE